MTNLRKNDLLSLLLCVILYGGFYFAIEEGLIPTLWSLHILAVLINIILVISLNLINGFTGQFSIGHAGFMAVGAYVSAVATMKAGAILNIPGLEVPFAVSLLVGGLAAGLLGFLVGLPTLRLNGDYLAIATLGLGEIIRIFILNIDYVGGAAGMSGIPRETNFTWAFWVMVLTLFVIKNFIRSTHGRACIAIRENEIAAEAMGIDTTRYKVIAFAMGAFFAGIAGGLFSHLYYIVHPSSFTFMRSFDILTMVVLGGLGSMTGSVLAAILLTLLSASLASYPEARMLIYASGLVALMIFRPQGLMGNKELSLQMLGFFKRKGGQRDAT